MSERGVCWRLKVWWRSVWSRVGHVALASYYRCKKCWSSDCGSRIVHGTKIKKWNAVCLHASSLEGWRTWNSSTGTTWWNYVIPTAWRWSEGPVQLLVGSAASKVFPEEIALWLGPELWISHSRKGKRHTSGIQNRIYKFKNRGTQMANMKICPASLLIREMQIKMMRYHLTPVRKAVSKKTDK